MEKNQFGTGVLFVALASRRRLFERQHSAQKRTG
jgi:hypothetical protein